MLSLLGQGTFGKVVKALDVRSRREMAVKIIRAVPKVRQWSTHEMSHRLTVDSTGMPVVLNSECFRLFEPPMTKIETDVFSWLTASIGVATYASLHLYLD